MRFPQFQKTVRAGLDAWGIHVDHGVMAYFIQHYQAMVETNQRFNLTAVTGEVEAAVLHFLDSLALLRFCRLAEGDSLIDVGAGAGFPGLVLKEARPDLQVMLLEASRKKVGFLQDLSGTLGLSGVQAVWGRAEEEAHRQGRREKYDWAVARGVASIRVLSEYCLPFVKEGGFFVAYKGPGGQQELKEAGSALGLLGGAVEMVESFPLPTGEERTLVIVRKAAGTPKRFPRRPGIPAQRPL